MNKLVYAVLSLALVGGLAYWVFAPHCNEPTKAEVVEIFKKCAVDIFENHLDQLKGDLCSVQGLSSDCDINAQNPSKNQAEAFDVLFKQRIYNCTKEKLEAKNMCTDFKNLKE